MNFDSFKKSVEAAGLKAIDCGKYHWRIEGGAQAVNWYPVSRKRTIYINGTEGGISFPGSEALAIEAAKGHLGKDKQHRQGRNARLRIKRKLLRKDPHCFGCQELLTMATATLDHIIPIGKGGTNAEGNYQLACEPCNTKKADKILLSERSDT